MPKKKKTGRIVLIIFILAAVSLLSYAVSKKMVKDNTLAENSTTEPPVSENISDAGTDSDFVIDKEEIADIFADAKTLSLDESTDLKKVCLNRFTKIENTFEAMLAQLAEGQDVWLWEEAAAAFEKMYAAAAEAGVDLEPIDGYCGFERQDRRYENRVKDFINYEGQTKYEAQLSASYFVLPAGHSEQYLGLTVWIGQESDSFKDTDAYIWLRNHAADYGFIERYPSGKESITYINYMPYAWRYVGTEIASAMAESGECLEEYFR